MLTTLNGCQLSSQILRRALPSAATPILFFAHPRTLARLNEFGLIERLRSNQHINLRPGVGYLEFVAVLQKAAFCVTDSGGVQQEACIIGVPAVTIMDETPWPDTLEHGANELCRPGIDPLAPAILRATKEIIRSLPLASTLRRRQHRSQYSTSIGRQVCRRLKSTHCQKFS